MSDKVKTNMVPCDPQEDGVLPIEGPQTPEEVFRHVRFRMSLGEILLSRYKSVR